MGISKLKEILSIFITARSPFEPVAIIEHATLPTQRVISGTVYSMHGQIQQDQIRMPAVIVIGKVVDEAGMSNVEFPTPNVQCRMSPDNYRDRSRENKQ